MSHKQLFSELVKMASEKKAYGYGMGMGGYSPYGYGMYGGRGMGRAGGMPWQHSGVSRFGAFQAGPHPAFIPGAISQQQAMAGAMGADAPNMGIGAARDYETFTGAQNRPATTFSQTITPQLSEQRAKMLSDAQREEEMHGQGITQAIGRQTKLREDMRKAQAAADAAKQNYEGRGFFGRISSSLGVGSGQTMYEEMNRLKNEADQMRQTNPTVAGDIDREIAMHQASRIAAQKRRQQVETEMGNRENRAYGHASNIDAQREGERREQLQDQRTLGVNRANVGQAAGASAIGQPAPPSLRRPVQGPGTAPKPVSGMPVQQHNAPMGTTPIKPVGHVKTFADRLLPAITMDTLAEGAARGMYERYVKIAVAKAEQLRKQSMELETAKYLGKSFNPRPLTPPAPQPKPQTLTTQKYYGKDPSEVNRIANNALLGRK